MLAWPQLRLILAAAICAIVLIAPQLSECAVVVVAEPTRADVLNDRPIVGVLTQEISWHLDGKWPGEYKSYIAASYVKFLEGGGARVVPIWIGRQRQYYEDIMKNINGVLWPGGATWFNATGGYSEAGRYMYEIAIRMNEEGKVMPIFGTCLGFELLAYLSSEFGDPRTDCTSDRQLLHLDFEPEYRKSRMFGEAPEDVLEILANEPVTPNFHQFCLTKANLTSFGMDREWQVLSVNKDWNGLEFISSMEHKRYPFFGVQFHPEKIIYEWIANRNISHTATAIRSGQYFAQFFVDQTRHSQNKFPGGVDEENSMLIYNFPTNFTALVKSAYTQCYLFDADVDYKSTARSIQTSIGVILVCLANLIAFSGIFPL